MNAERIDRINNTAVSMNEIYRGKQSEQYFKSSSHIAICT